jgi:hypothetical protein
VYGEGVPQPVGTHVADLVGLRIDQLAKTRAARGVTHDLPASTSVDPEEEQFPVLAYRTTSCCVLLDHVQGVVIHGKPPHPAVMTLLSNSLLRRLATAGAEPKDPGRMGTALLA